MVLVYFTEHWSTITIVRQFFVHSTSYNDDTYADHHCSENSIYNRKGEFTEEKAIMVLLKLC